MSETQEVQRLLDLLNRDLEMKEASRHDLLKALEQLKVLGRNPKFAVPISRAEAIKTLATYGFDREADEVSYEALRCLANALLLEPKTQQCLVDLGYAGAVARRLGTNSDEEEFLCSRILFLLTYKTDLDFEQLVGTCDLASSISQNLIRHCQSSIAQRSKDAMEDAALAETLKLLFNITHKSAAIAAKFTSCITTIMDLLRNVFPQLNAQLEPPVTLLLNPLLNFDLATKAHAEFFPSSRPSLNVVTLINILDAVTTLSQPRKALTHDDHFTALITLIRYVYDAAPPAVRSFMQDQLLPADEERSQPLGKSDSLSSHLLQLCTSAASPTVWDSIASLLFQMSDKNVEKFVHNVGYGYASGYLVTHNLVPPKMTTEDEAVQYEGGAKSGDSRTGARNINRVTGQYKDREADINEAPMTEDEKMREAEKLFVLFERLKKTGVVDVQNPVQAAYESGRFEEVEEDE